MNIGIDVGFSATKALGDGGKSVLFPSVVGTPQYRHTFSLGQAGGLALRLEDSQAYTPIGDTALLQSQYSSGSRDSAWVLEDEWELLLCGALSSYCNAPYSRINVCTGLPVYDWQQYRDALRNKLSGAALSFQVRDKARQEVEIANSIVVTQPYGTYADLLLTEDGATMDNVWATGWTAVLDFGGNHFNWIVTKGQELVDRWCGSDEFGLLRMLDNVAATIRADLSGYAPQTHEVAEALAAGRFRYRGEDRDVWPYAEEYMLAFLTQAQHRIREALPEAGRLDAVALTGGGAAAVGSWLVDEMSGRYANVRVVDDPRWANVRGYLKIANRMWAGD